MKIQIITKEDRVALEMAKGFTGEKTNSKAVGSIVRMHSKLLDDHRVLQQENDSLLVMLASLRRYGKMLSTGIEGITRMCKDMES